jgi:hypothetical protein
VIHRSHTSRIRLFFNARAKWLVRSAVAHSVRLLLAPRHRKPTVLRVIAKGEVLSDSHKHLADNGFLFLYCRSDRKFSLITWVGPMCTLPDATLQAYRTAVASYFEVFLVAFSLL